jgi:hypothetical protein
MYLLTIDDTYLKKSINHRLFIVAVGYWLYKVYGRIDFTGVNKKFFFLNKITEITQELVNEIRAFVAKDVLIQCGPFMCMLCFCV